MGAAWAPAAAAEPALATFGPMRTMAVGAITEAEFETLKQKALA